MGRQTFLGWPFHDSTHKLLLNQAKKSYVFLQNKCITLKEYTNVENEHGQEYCHENSSALTRLPNISTFNSYCNAFVSWKSKFICGYRVKNVTIHMKEFLWKKCCTQNTENENTYSCEFVVQRKVSGADNVSLAK